MAKTEDLLKKMDEHRPRSKGVVAVLAQKEVILAALENGHSLRTIHKTLMAEELMPIQYSSFARLVKKYLTKGNKVTPNENLDSEPKGSKSEKSGEDLSYKPDFESTKKRFV